MTSRSGIDSLVANDVKSWWISSKWPGRRRRVQLVHASTRCGTRRRERITACRQQHILDRLDQHGRHGALRRPGAPAHLRHALEPSRLMAATIAAFISTRASGTSRATVRRQRGEHLHEPDHGRALPVGGRPEEHDQWFHRAAAFPNERRLNLGVPIVARSA